MTSIFGGSSDHKKSPRRSQVFSPAPVSHRHLDISDFSRDVTKTGNGEWGMENGEWGMGNGEWRMENGEWGMGNGEWGMRNNGQR